MSEYHSASDADDCGGCGTSGAMDAGRLKAAGDENEKDADLEQTGAKLTSETVNSEVQQLFESSSVSASCQVTYVSPFMCFVPVTHNVDCPRDC